MLSLAAPLRARDVRGQPGLIDNRNLNVDLVGRKLDRHREAVRRQVAASPDDLHYANAEHPLDSLRRDGPAMALAAWAPLLNAAAR